MRAGIFQNKTTEKKERNECPHDRLRDISFSLSFYLFFFLSFLRLSKIVFSPASRYFTLSVKV